MARLSVTVPAGVKDGQRLKLKGEGDSPSGQGVPGDLYVIVNYQNHSLFERDNDDVRMSLPISFVDALLGSEVEIPTLRGAAQLKVPAGASSGQVFRLKNKGFPKVGGKGSGDMLVTLLVDTPKRLTAQEAKLVEELRDKLGDPPQVEKFKQAVAQLKKVRSTPS